MFTVTGAFWWSGAHHRHSALGTGCPGDTCFDCAVDGNEIHDVGFEDRCTESHMAAATPKPRPHAAAGT
jgi:hypothetical protein